jgi:hypothetical protein
MYTKKYFEELLYTFGETKSINKYFLLSVILEQIIKVDFGKIDFERFVFKENSQGYDIVLASIEDQHCTFYIEILNNNEIDLQLNMGGEYIYLQPINNWSDVKRMREALIDVFTSPIKEKLVYTNGKLKEVSYGVNHFIEGQSIYKQYKLVLGTLWPWQNNEKLINNYKPWLP